MPTWAVADDVRARLSYETIDGSSSPNTTQVEAWIDEAEARIRGVLRAAGLATTYSDTDSVNILTNVVADYVEGRVRLAWGSGTGGVEDTEAGERLIIKFDTFIQDLRHGAIQLGSELDPGGDVPDSIQLARSHIDDNEDGLTLNNGDFDPKFEIGGVNY